jgi:hypothetical protein
MGLFLGKEKKREKRNRLVSTWLGVMKAILCVTRLGEISQFGKYFLSWAHFFPTNRPKIA